MANSAELAVKHSPTKKHAVGEPNNKLGRYVDVNIKPHVLLWDETVPAPSIWFMRQKLGISELFYRTQIRCHTH